MEPTRLWLLGLCSSSKRTTPCILSPKILTIPRSPRAKWEDIWRRKNKILSKRSFPISITAVSKPRFRGKSLTRERVSGLLPTTKWSIQMTRRTAIHTLKLWFSKVIVAVVSSMDLSWLKNLTALLNQEFLMLGYQSSPWLFSEIIRHLASKPQ